MRRCQKITYRRVPDFTALLLHEAGCCIEGRLGGLRWRTGRCHGAIGEDRKCVTCRGEYGRRGGAKSVEIR